MKRFVLLLALYLMTTTITAAAPTHGPDAVVYMYTGTLYAQAFNGEAVQVLGDAYHGAELTLPDAAADIYNRAASPLSPAAVGSSYGFYHGVWSPDRKRFAYVEMAHLDTAYRLQMIAEGRTTLLLDARIDSSRGYLDPLGWTGDGKLLLMERRSRYLLKLVRVWSLDVVTGDLKPYYDVALPEPLRGGSAVTTSGNRAFIGFEAKSLTGYSFDFQTRQVSRFFASVELPNPYHSIFERYPVTVIGVMSLADAQTFGLRLHSGAAVDPLRPAPFLGWPLSNEHRHISCYPDSSWTQANFEVNCPALGVMYEGHQGTDVSGRPNGLPRGTDVYAAAPGIVVMSYAECAEGNPSCNGAYGNVVALEHTLVVNGAVQVWLTGYAHLSEPLVEAGDIITDLTQPIARSGSTGSGGPHLHFEVRYPHSMAYPRWIDPWDMTLSAGAGTMWVGNAYPIAPVSQDCTTC